MSESNDTPKPEQGPHGLGHGEAPQPQPETGTSESSSRPAKTFEELRKQYGGTHRKAAPGRVTVMVPVPREKGGPSKPNSKGSSGR